MFNRFRVDFGLHSEFLFASKINLGGTWGSKLRPSILNNPLDEHVLCLGGCPGAAKIASRIAFGNQSNPLLIFGAKMFPNDDKLLKNEPAFILILVYAGGCNETQREGGWGP